MLWGEAQSNSQVGKWVRTSEEEKQLKKTMKTEKLQISAIA